MRRLIGATCFTVCCTAATAFAATINVPADQLTIQAAVNAAAPGDTIVVAAGTYLEDVLVNKTLTITGAGIDVSTVSGVRTSSNPQASTFQIAAAGVEISGFTITRDGNTVADWNDNLNTAGLGVQGIGNSVIVHDCKFTGNRTAIDLNNTDGSTIRNNIIDNNRSGVLLRNPGTNHTIVENEITNNWTIGVLWLDASVETATGTVFSNNKISGNWYAEIENRSLTGGMKNFSGNWLGTTQPVVVNTNAGEPGYAVQIPVAFGGTAVPPGGAATIKGVGFADLDYTPWLDSSTDTNVETVLGRGTNGFQGSYAALHVDDNSAQVGSEGRIQEAVDLSSAAGTVNVHPGSYIEKATNRFVLAPSAQGPYQFGVFVDLNRDNLTIRGVDAGGAPVTTYAGVVADVVTDATNNFGTSGWFIEGDGVTVSGLELSYNVSGTNKTMEVIGDDFTLVDCVVADFDQTFFYGGSIYFNDWRVNDNGTPTDFSDDISHQQSYNVQDNSVIWGNTIDFTSGAGFSGPVASRTITGNDFDVTRHPMDPNSDPIFWPVVSFNGSGSCVPWFVYGVGGATISGNDFFGLDAAQFIRARADYDNSQFDWFSYWTGNTYSKGTVALVTEMPFDVRTSTLPTFCGTFTNVRRIGATIQGEVDRAITGDLVLAKPGAYEEQVHVPAGKNNLTIRGSGNGANPATSTIVQSPVALALSYTTGDINKPVIFVDGADNATIRNLRVDGLDRGNSNYRFQGIAFWNADGTVRDCHVTNIRDPIFPGFQIGLAIVATNNGGGPYAMTVRNCVVENYQKNGIVMSGNGLTANIIDCVADGGGPDPIIARNGIQVSFGASATIDGCTVQNHSYIPNTFVSSGMILFDAATVSVLDSQAFNNDVSIYAQDTNVIIDSTDVTHSDDGLWDAIDLVNTVAAFTGDERRRPAASPVFEFVADEIGDRGLADMTALITNCTLVGNDNPMDPNSAGIYAFSSSGLLEVTALHNDISDWRFGFNVFEVGSGTVATTANLNKIYSNTDAGFSMFGSTVQNAENNWWGDCSGPLDAFGSDEAGNPPCFPAATMSNTDGLGNGVTDQNVDYCPWLCNPATVSLLPQGGDTCLEPGDTLVVEIKLTDLAPIIVGGQFYLSYDNTLLTYTGGVVGDLPFITEIIDMAIAPNKIFYSAGVSIFGGTGTTADTVIARLSFTVNAMSSACSLAAAIGFLPDAGPLQNKLSDEFGDPVLFTQNPLPPITIDNVAPTVGSISVTGGDVDSACQRLVTFAATINDNCCLLAANVSASVSLTTANATLGAPTINISQVDADTVSVSGSVLVSALTSCPATVQLTVNAADCCGNAMLAASATGNVNDTTAPVVTLGNGNITTNADAGGCDALVAWNVASATDNCDGSPTITYDIDLDDDSSLDAIGQVGTSYTFPTGTHRVYARGTDNCGNVGSASFTVTVDAFSDLVVTVQLEWAFTGSRCITFELFDCTGPTSSVVSSVMSFTAGTASDTIEVPCGAYTCITARDRLHTLRRTIDPLTDLGTQFAASFTGGDKLIGGNLNDDDFIDILDFGVYSFQYGVNYGSPNTTCATPYPHADISGSIGTPGLVFTEDFTFIQINFLQMREANCCGLAGVMSGDPTNVPFDTLPNSNGPITAVSIDELKEAGLLHLAAGDLNHDGMLDVWDMLAFMIGARPEPRGPIATDQVETIDGSVELKSAPIHRLTPRTRP